MKTQLCFSFLVKAQLWFFTFWEAQFCFTRKQNCAFHFRKAQFCFTRKHNCAFHFQKAHLCITMKHSCSFSHSVLQARVNIGKITKSVNQKMHPKIKMYHASTCELNAQHAAGLGTPDDTLERLMRCLWISLSHIISWESCCASLGPMKAAYENN